MVGGKRQRRKGKSVGMDRAEERELIRRAQAGDRAASGRLVLANQGLLYVPARAAWQRYGGELEDYAQAGREGLMHGIAKFDLARPDLKLMSYASHWVKAYIQRWTLEQSSMVKIGTTTWQRVLFYKLPAVRAELEQRLERPPTHEELARGCDVTVAQVEEMLLRTGHDLSLDAPLGEDPDGATHLDCLADPAASFDGTEVSEGRRLRALVEHALQGLDPRERRIMEARFMDQGDEKPPTFQELGDELGGISRERARQLQERAIAKLRTLLRPARRAAQG